jgi:hypothetical protein
MGIAKLEVSYIGSYLGWHLEKRCIMGYDSASMVEFIVDMLSNDFNFVEMNT